MGRARTRQVSAALVVLVAHRLDLGREQRLEQSPFVPALASRRNLLENLEQPRSDGLAGREGCGRANALW